MPPKLTYANVMSTLCFFLLLGGGAYAASHLGKNSVGTKQLKKNAVTSPKVKDHSLEALDFKAGQLPAGEPGQVGAPGARGPSDGYASNTTKFVNFIAGEQVLESITLPPGKYILTGYANANNNAATLQEAECEITLGGTNIGSTRGFPLGPNAEGDQEELAVSGGGTLVASGVAVLRCFPSTSEGSWLASGLTAIQVASLNGG